MANEHNLKPVRSKREARERGRNGGIKSGATRRRKAALRDTMNKLLTMQVEVDGFPGMDHLDLTSFSLMKGEHQDGFHINRYIRTGEGAS